MGRYLRPDSDAQLVYRVTEPADPGPPVVPAVYGWVVEDDVATEAYDTDTATYQSYAMVAQTGHGLTNAQLEGKINYFEFTWPTGNTRKIRQIDVLLELTTLPTRTTCKLYVYDGATELTSQELAEQSGQQTVQIKIAPTQASNIKLKVVGDTTSGTDTHITSTVKVYDVAGQYIVAGVMSL